jgi:hypothetical protein
LTLSHQALLVHAIIVCCIGGWTIHASLLVHENSAAIATLVNSRPPSGPDIQMSPAVQYPQRRRRRGVDTEPIVHGIHARREGVNGTSDHRYEVLTNCDTVLLLGPQLETETTGGSKLQNYTELRLPQQINLKRFRLERSSTSISPPLNLYPSIIVATSRRKRGKNTPLLWMPQRWNLRLLPSTILCRHDGL